MSPQHIGLAIAVEIAGILETPLPGPEEPRTEIGIDCCDTFILADPSIAHQPFGDEMAGLLAQQDVAHAARVEVFDRLSLRSQPENECTHLINAATRVGIPCDGKVS